MKIQAIMSITNTLAMGISVSENGEQVTSCYCHNGNFTDIEVSSVQYDEEGKPYFIRSNGTTYKVADFIRYCI